MSVQVSRSRVITDRIADDAVNAAKIATDAVDSAEIKAGAVGTSELASAVGNFGAWTNYTPTLTNVTSGNGSLTAAYCQIGKLVAFRVVFSLGSTSAITGRIQVALPTTASSSYQTAFWGNFQDSGTTTYPAYLYLETASKVEMRAQNSSGTYLSYADTSATVPFTWTSTDLFALGGVYEAA